LSPPRQQSADQQPPHEEKNIIENIAMQSSQVFNAAPGAPAEDTKSYFEKLGINTEPEDHEADRLEDKIKESSHLSIYREDLLYSEKSSKSSRFSKLSDLIKNRNTFERPSNSRSPDKSNPQHKFSKDPKPDEHVEEPVKKPKNIGGVYNFINPKSKSIAPAVAAPDDTQSVSQGKKFKTSIQDNYKIASGTSLKKSGTAGNLLKSLLGKADADQNPAASLDQKAGHPAAPPGAPQSKLANTPDTDPHNLIIVNEKIKADIAQFNEKMSSLQKKQPSSGAQIHPPLKASIDPAKEKKKPAIPTNVSDARNSYPDKGAAFSFANPKPKNSPSSGPAQPLEVLVSNMQKEINQSKSPKQKTPELIPRLHEFASSDSHSYRPQSDLERVLKEKFLT